MTELSFHNDNYHQSLIVSYFLNNKIYDSDRKLITERTSKMVEKTNNHIKEILHNIEKLKPNTCKKYQISGYHEYKLLTYELLLINNITYELIEDDILLKNVVSEIKGRYSDGCCYDCDGIYKYNHKKVPVLYLKIYIRPSQI